MSSPTNPFLSLDRNHKFSPVNNERVFHGTPQKEATRLRLQQRIQFQNLSLPYSSTNLSSSSHLDKRFSAEIDNALVIQARALQQKLDASESVRNDLEEKLYNLERQVELIQKKNAALSSNDARLDIQVYELEVRNQELLDQLSNKEITIGKLRQEIKQINLENINFSDQLEALKSNEQSLKRSNEKLRQKLDIESMNSYRHHSNLTKDKSDLQNDIDRLKKEVTKLKRERSISRPRKGINDFPQNLLNDASSFDENLMPCMTCNVIDVPVEETLIISGDNLQAETSKALLQQFKKQIEQLTTDVKNLSDEKCRLERLLDEAHEHIEILQNEIDGRDLNLHDHVIVDNSMALYEFSHADDPIVETSNENILTSKFQNLTEFPGNLSVISQRNLLRELETSMFADNDYDNEETVEKCTQTDIVSLQPQSGDAPMISLSELFCNTQIGISRDNERTHFTVQDLSSISLQSEIGKNKMTNEIDLNAIPIGHLRFSNATITGSITDQILPDKIIGLESNPLHKNDEAFDTYQNSRATSTENSIHIDEQNISHISDFQNAAFGYLQDISIDLDKSIQAETQENADEDIMNVDQSKKIGFAKMFNSESAITLSAQIGHDSEGRSPILAEGPKVLFSALPLDDAESQGESKRKRKDLPEKVMTDWINAAKEDYSLDDARKETTIIYTYQVYPMPEKRFPNVCHQKSGIRKVSDADLKHQGLKSPFEALAHAMIGSWFQKFNRRGKNPKLRFFWVNPYSKTLNWSSSPISQDSRSRLIKIDKAPNDTVFLGRCSLLKSVQSVACDL